MALFETNRTTKIVATSVLKRFKCSDDEIRRALTDDVVKELGRAAKSEQARILDYVRMQIETERAERASAPEVFKTADFRCERCGREELNVIISVAGDAKLTEQKMDCPDAPGHVMSFFWPLGTKMAVLGEENVPKAQLEAARSGAIRGGPDGVQPFAGATRSELKKWERDNGVMAVASDEVKRGNSVVHTKTKTSQTKEFGDALMERTRVAEEIVRAGGDRLAEAKLAIEQPNEYDVSKAKQQATTTLDRVSGALQKERAVDVNDFTTELEVVNQ